MTTLRMYRKNGDRWYADVKSHTEEENEMVGEANKMCSIFAKGADEFTVTMSQEIPCKSDGGVAAASPLFVLKRELHDSFGGTYNVYKHEESKEENQIKICPPVWLCNVAHTVFGGEHPETIYIYDILPNAKVDPVVKNT